MNNDLPLSRLFLFKSPSLTEQMTKTDELDTSEQSAAQRSDSFQIATNLLLSFQYAGQGVGYAFRTQRNFRIHLMIGAIALSLSLYFRLSAIACSIISLTISLVLVLELLNTALEAVVDLTVGREFHQLAKIAKDCAAGAVLIAAIAALIIASVLLLPNIFIAISPT
ncbi:MULTISPECIES: diacylglycerol kinase family protein [Pseudanabaena]|jgi:diacylglycerol kinase (ATP)|uniref:diacylglycerol kinase family protein n=1 Tax=Pseudanabaena TaxID=1152 RepID=UPI00247861F6|nr:MULTISPECIES: diacylglycerol kinase family protein [Pseudanabaena]MEA5487908.1 diacylglycerol kinase family protein [Pseudanabaena sp. CCNP1317]WGS73829.1 diacylglycerol kinase family protein [Pseudanabaena galeata CCNP1313]